MKTVILVRHAKSSWDYPDLRDIERPLNNRGLRDAPFMAKMLTENGVIPDAIYSSPAVRALTTATFFKNAFGLDGEDILIRDEIYEAMPSQILRLIQMMPEKHSMVMLFGHNPTFTSVANMFSKSYIGNVPTCGIVQIEASINNWSEFREHTGDVTAFYYPKQYFK